MGKKPTGQTGFVRIKIEGNNTNFHTVRFPDTKEEIETKFINDFLINSQAQQMFPFKVTGVPVQNETDDFDFTVETNQGSKYFELMEIAPLDFFKSKYRDAPNYYKDYDFASYIYEKIMWKSNRYKGSTDLGINLLIYITDWKFVLSNVVIALLKYWTVKGNHSFEGIFYFSHLSQNEGVTYLIYPTSVDYFSNFDENKYKENKTFLLNPTGWEFKVE